MSHFGSSALREFSLVDKRCREAAAYSLFDHLDLGKRDGDELEKLYNDLFGGADEFNSKRLSTRHFNTVTVQILEDACNTTEDGEFSEFELCQQVVSKFFERLKSVGTVQLELILSDDGSIDSWKSIIKPAVEDLAKKFAGKVDKVELWIESFATHEEDDDAIKFVDTKVGNILSAFPLIILQSLHLIGILVDKGANALTALINSPHLHSLTLRDCRGDFSNWTPQYLRLLTMTSSMTWAPSKQDWTPADFLLALKLMASSASTLEGANYQNIDGISYAKPVSIKPFVMTELTRLELADSHLGRGSLVDTFMMTAVTPKLRTLDLTTEDALSSDLHDLPDKIPSLRYLKIKEGRIRSAPTDGDASNYRSTQEACQKNNVALHTEYSILRCDDWNELSSELSRVRSLADDLVSLSLSLRSAALLGLEISGDIVFPELRRLSIGITDVGVSPVGEDEYDDEPDGGLEVPSLINLIQHMDAPYLRELQVTLFAEKNCSFLEDLNSVIVKQRFPKLELLGGAIVASNDMEDEGFSKMEDVLRDLCEKHGVDSIPMRFISRNALGFGEGSESEDEELDETDEELDEASAAEQLDTILEEEDWIEEEEGVEVEVDEEEDMEEEDEGFDREQEQEQQDKACMNEDVSSEDSGIDSNIAYQAKLKLNAAALRANGRLRAASETSYDSWETDDD